MDKKISMAKNTVLKGTYCLLINLNKNQPIEIGKKGEIPFKKGFYVYVGSALNSLEGRIRRHLRKDKKLHWHVDYLLDAPNSQIVEVYLSYDGIKHECDLATYIAGEGRELQGFGSSDCKCNSHLIYFSSVAEADAACRNAFKKMGLNLDKLKDLLD